MSSPLLNSSVILQGAVLLPYLFTTCFCDMSNDPPAQLLKDAHDVLFWQAIFSEPEFALTSGNLLNIMNFSSKFDLHLNVSDCTFALSRPPFHSERSVVDAVPVPRAKSVKYLIETVCTKTNDGPRTSSIVSSLNITCLLKSVDWDNLVQSKPSLRLFFLSPVEKYRWPKFPQHSFLGG